MNNKIATTVKVEPELYHEFKVLGVIHRVTLQSFVEKVIYRYVNEDSFRQEMNNFIFPITTAILGAVTSSISA